MSAKLRLIVGADDEPIEHVPLVEWCSDSRYRMRLRKVRRGNG